jgi:hypothetical protein
MRIIPSIVRIITIVPSVIRITVSISEPDRNRGAIAERIIVVVVRRPPVITEVNAHAI